MKHRPLSSNIGHHENVTLHGRQSSDLAVYRQSGFGFSIRPIPQSSIYTERVVRLGSPSGGRLTFPRLQGHLLRHEQLQVTGDRFVGPQVGGARKGVLSCFFLTMECRF